MKSVFETVMGKARLDLCLHKRIHEAWSFTDQTSSEIPKSHVVSSPELTSLAYFDKAESAPTKRNTVAALTKKGEDYVV